MSAFEMLVRFCEIVALVLAAVAIFYARRQYDDSKVLLSNAQTHAQRLEAIANALPTRFVGTFPDNLRPITDLVRTSKKSLHVLVDFVGYGYFSNPLGFKTYYEALRGHAQDAAVQLEIVCYTKTGKGAQAAFNNQFPANDFALHQQSEAFKQFYTKYFPTLTAPQNVNDFEKDSWDHEEAYRANVYHNGANTSLVVTTEPMPFLLWLRDGEEAIVSFQNLTTFGDFSFRTADPTFIEFFKEQLKLVKNGGNQYAPPAVATSKPLLLS